MQGFFYIFIYADPVLIKVISHPLMKEYEEDLEFIQRGWEEYKQKNLTNWIRMMIDLNFFSIKQSEFKFSKPFIYHSVNKYFT